MLVRTVLVDALHPALEDRIEALDGVRMRFPANVFLGSMVDRLMTGEATARAAISRKIVGHETALRIRLGDQHTVELGGRSAVDMDGARLAAALHQRHDLHLVL